MYKLKAGYLLKRLPHPNRAPLNGWLAGRSQRERQRLSWHLPENFETRSECKKKEIVDWISKNIIGCATAFGQYQARIQKNAFAIKLVSARRDGRPSSVGLSSASNERVPSAQLALEVEDLVNFKTSTFTKVDEKRLGIWNKETVRLHLRRLGLMLGAMATPAHSSTSGPGFPRGGLTLALLVLPSVWDWYLSWRLNRRGSFSLDEVSILRLGISLTRPLTGWLRQRPLLAQRIVLHAAIVTEAEISAAQDWTSACDTCFRHLKVRLAEVKRIARRHRDPFEAIRVVLGQPDPVVVYRRIADEILKHFPDVRRYPVAAAETARSLLMVRLGLHLGLRQRNLRELLLCLPGQPYRSEFELEYRRRGEMRWCEATKRWEIFIPSVAFKNSESTFFSGHPFHLALPDVQNLYGLIASYVDVYRPLLLRGSSDPGTIFIKLARSTSGSSEYDQHGFYIAWRGIVERYGIYNPYTDRGAVRGLLPHGPHSVRDVIATHVLKATGSYEQAAYAIQCSPEIVAQHYGRFYPGDKSELASRVLRQAWEPS